MKKLNFFSLIGAVVLALGVGVGAALSHNQEPTPVYADNLDTISIRLNVNNFDKENLDYKFEFKEITESGHNVYDLKIRLEDGTQFHLLRNYDSSAPMGHNDTSSETNSEYFTVRGTYFQIIGTNDYIITFTDNSTISWTRNLHIEPYTPVDRTLTYHISDTETESEVYFEGTRWNSKFYEKEGYHLEGWYTEQEFINKFERNDRIDGDMDLYPKYVETDDYTIIVEKDNFYFDSESNPVMHINYRRNNLDNALVTVEIDESPSIDNYYMVTVDASKSFDTISIGASIEGTARQTEEFSLTPHKTYEVELMGEDFTPWVEVKTLAYSLVSLLYDLGGEWNENTGTTTNCAANYQAAKEMFLNFDDVNYEQWRFETDGTGEIWNNARARYEAWCYANGDSNPYDSTSALNNVLRLSETNYNFLMPTIIALVCVALVTVVIIKKRRTN